MTRGETWLLAALAALALCAVGCEPKSNNQAYDGAQQNARPKNFLATQQQDARRAADSMPAPTGGQ
jgi:hypothetical protein